MADQTRRSGRTPGRSSARAGTVEQPAGQRPSPPTESARVEVLIDEREASSGDEAPLIPQEQFVPDERVATALLSQRPDRRTPATGVATAAPSGELGPEQANAPSALTRSVPTGMLGPLAPQRALEVRAPGNVDLACPPLWVAIQKPTANPDARLILLREPDSARAASFRVLRHRLREQGDPRVIAITSANAEEGKTTCAVNLALALGESGRARVLLVEANLRAPALVPLLGIVPPECFRAQMLRHRDKPEEPWKVVEIFSPCLHVLAVQPVERNVARPLLDGPAFSLALAQLRQAGYDYIVIDTPPVLGAADVNLIEDSADGVLFVARAGETSSRALRAAVEQLAPAKVLGVTLFDL